MAAHPERRARDQEFEGPGRRLDDRVRLLEVGHRELVDQLSDMSVTMSEAVATGMRKALTDPTVLQAVWSAAMQQGQRGLHERAGRWLFSRWTAIAALVFLLSSYIGWPATIKAILGLLKGAP